MSLFSIIYLLLLPCLVYAEYERTIVFIRVTTQIGQNVFLRGGISSHIRPNCVEDAATDPCAIPIVHRIQPTDPLSSYLAWSQGDDHLDWYGAEDEQGDYAGTVAGGSPLIWTSAMKPGPTGPTVEVDGHGYTPLNRFGDHYWMLDMDMDCDATEGGWFEFKTYITPTIGWEDHISQYGKCAGEPTISKPYTTLNHLGRCGKMNVFYNEEDECIVYDVPQNPEIEPPVGCGERQMFDDGAADSQQLIVGGEAARVGWWPWQGVLQYSTTIGGCGGLLIDENWALTAAHCVLGTDPSILRIRLGEQNLVVTQGNEQAVQVLRIHFHECYRSGTCGDIPYNDYDVAVLELATSADISTSYVANKACLPKGMDTDDFVGNSNCWATGFGDTQGTADRYRLNEVNTPVWSYAACVGHWGASRVTIRQMCMGSPAISACGGDSGSPLSCYHEGKWYAVGLTSWGSSDCSGPSVYSRLTEFIDWIEGITGPIAVCQ